MSDCSKQMDQTPKPKFSHICPMIELSNTEKWVPQVLYYLGSVLLVDFLSLKKIADS